MAGKRRKSSGRKSSGGGKIASKIPLINNPTFKKAAMGAGAVSLLTLGLSLVGQQGLASNPLLKLGTAFVVGDLPGVATQILPSLGGNTNLFGGGGGNMAGMA